MPLFKKKKEGESEIKKERKPFKETKLGIFLKEKAPHILDIAADMIPGASGLHVIKKLIDKDGSFTKEDKQKAIELLNHELELYKVDQVDRADARAREREYVKANKIDWMMIITGASGLSAFLFIVICSIYKPDVFEKNPVLHQIVGMVEGVAISIFMYYFGSSKGSADKTKMLGGN